MAASVLAPCQTRAVGDSSPTFAAPEGDGASAIFFFFFLGGGLGGLGGVGGLGGFGGGGGGTPVVR